MSNPLAKKIVPCFYRIKNNNFINVAKLAPNLYETFDTYSPDAKKYLRVPSVIVGTHDIRARSGSFRNPWRADVPKWYAPHPFTFTTDSLSDIADQRAIELVNIAKSTNKKIIIMWSGGIDSTFMLTAFLKNISLEDQELLTVACTSQSIADNTDFYLKFLSANTKIKLINAVDLYVNNDCLTNNLVLHGDPADGVFGPSGGMYSHFSTQDQHLEPWRKHLPTMASLIEPKVEVNGFTEPGLGSWYCDIVTRTLEESGQADYISTVADWWWWNYFNFKWHLVTLMPLFSTLLDEQDEGITLENQKIYADTAYFNSPAFQHWSYSNLKELIGHNFFNTHKLKAREYIYEFDNNFQYFSRKRKTGVALPTQKMQKGNIIGYDDQFRPIQGGHEVRQVIDTLLQKYKI
jgi:hypothetical protein